MTDATIGYGTKFEISSDAGVTWVGVGEVTNVSPPSDNIDVIDATHTASPNATREFILGLNDPGECAVEINFVPGSPGDTKLQQVRAARATVRCRITWPNDITWTFDGILTGYEPDAPMDDKMTATVTFKVTGSYVTGLAS